jgi:hypothetical protein
VAARLTSDGGLVLAFFQFLSHVVPKHSVKKRKNPHGPKSNNVNSWMQGAYISTELPPKNF